MTAQRQRDTIHYTTLNTLSEGMQIGSDFRPPA
jgi:hypothetical protein